MNILKKWWGWGNEEKHYDLKRREKFLPYLNQHFSLPNAQVLPIPKLEEFQLGKPRLTPEELEELSHIIEETGCFTTKKERIEHAVGKSYYDLIRLRYKKALSFPDAVVYPQSETQIIELLAWANKKNIAIIPFGGGTSVVGGVEASCDSKKSVISLDLAYLDKVLEINTNSLIVKAEAGITGPQLETALQKKGMTLGHFPESFEFSTLGGWLATRSAGQFSTKYGKIEEMVESIRLVTPSGIIETPAVPASATGPDLNQLIVGSEGILGVITSARMKIHPLPSQNWYQAFLFLRLEDGIEFGRTLMNRGGRPSLFRLLDGYETELAFALAKWPKNKLALKIAELFIKRMELKGFLSSTRALLFLGFDGSSKEIKAQKAIMKKAFQGLKVLRLGKFVVDMWYKHRYDNPYLRDELLNYGLLVDTLETSTEWDNLISLYQATRKAILNSFKKLQIPGLAMAHLSHLYPQGSSLYFIILAQPILGQEIEQWQDIKKAASQAIIENGATISHHHGVGLDHRVWYGQQLDPCSFKILQNWKNTVDPQGIMNPGKLLP